MSNILAPTQAEVKARLHYDETTGVFTWLASGRRVSAGMRAGSVTNKGYIRIKINAFPYPAHRLAWLYVHGEWPSTVVDHIDNDKLNNRISNLRLATHSQNCANQKRRITNKSGFKGVSLKTGLDRWQAVFRREGKNHYLGSFKTKEEAYAVYCDAISKVDGEFARAA